MNSWSQSVLRVAALAGAALVLSACASKGATTLDEDANQPASERSGPSEPRCGNGEIEEGEECDGTELDGVTCANLGFEGGELSCDAMCTFDVGACTRPPTAPMGGNGG
jgi:hypothetical protein